jgi:acid phosphatase type 7
MLTKARRRFAQLRSSRAEGLLIGDAPATQRRRALGIAAVCVLATVAVAQLLAPSETRSATQTFTVTADSYVSESNPDAVHGDMQSLLVDGGPLERTSYLRVDIPPAHRDLKKATLRVFSTQADPFGVAVRFVADDNWRESTLTFNNRPDHVGRVLGHSGPVAANQWVDIDITDELLENPAIADGGSLELSLATSLFAFVGAVDPEHSQEAASEFASRESGTPPELKIETAPGPSVDTTTSSSEPGATTTAPAVTTTVPRATTSIAPPPPPPPGGVMHVAAVGDIQPPSSSSNSSATAALAGRADFILGLGDYQYQGGSMSDYNAYFDHSWGPNVPKMYPVLAPTHDQNWQAGDTLNYWNGGGASGVHAPVRLQALSPYSFTRGGWHFVALPDACYRVSGCDGNAITTWLANDLAANPTPCTVAYFHQAYFTSAADHDPFAPVAPWVKVLVDHHVDILLQGHNHNYERFALQNEARGADPNGIQAFVVGTGGIGFYAFRGLAPNSVTRQADTFGVLDLSLGNGSYSWSFARAGGGNYSDSGSMACR